MAVAKIRASQHSKDLHEYDIAADGGIVVGAPLLGYQGLLTGTPTLDGKTRKT
jgi:circadian clock protein KaiC